MFFSFAKSGVGRATKAGVGGAADLLASCKGVVDHAPALRERIAFNHDALPAFLSQVDPVDLVLAHAIESVGADPVGHAALKVAGIHRGCWNGGGPKGRGDGKAKDTAGGGVDEWDHFRTPFLRL